LQGLLAGSGRSFILAGAALEGLNRPADARAAYEQAAAAGELVADPILALARLDVREGKANVGLARIDKQIAVTPDVASLHAMRGDVLLSLNRPGEAATSYERATKIQPAWVQAYRGQASALVAAGQVERAIEVLGNALAPTGDALIILADLSALNAKAGRPDEAIRALEDALARAPNDMLVANNLAMLLANHRAGDPRSMERAISLASRFADSQDPILLDTYGWVLHRAGRSAEAVPLLQKAVAQAPQVSEYQYHLGMALLVSGDRAAARTLLEAAVRDGGQFEGAAEARKALGGL
jgi:tetratricopeptide (TPR) repeat protein